MANMTRDFLKDLEGFGPFFIKKLGLQTSGRQPDGSYHYPGEGPVMVDVSPIECGRGIGVAACAQPAERGHILYVVPNTDAAIRKPNINGIALGILRRRR